MTVSGPNYNLLSYRTAGVGVGTTPPDVNYSLTVGSPGTGKTDLFVYNKAVFAGTRLSLRQEVDLKSTLVLVASEQFTDLITPVVKSTSNCYHNFHCLLLTLIHLFLHQQASALEPQRGPDLDIDGSTRLKTYHEM